MRCSVRSLSRVLAVVGAVLSAGAAGAVRGDDRGGSLVPNGDVETDADGDGHPDHWFARAPGDGVIADWIAASDGAGRFLRVRDASETAGQGVIWRSRARAVAAENRVGTFRWRWRYAGVHPDGVQIVFRFFEGPPAPSGSVTGRFLGQVGKTASGTSDGWADESTGFVVPAGAGSTDVLVYSNTDANTGELLVDDMAATLAERVSPDARMLWQLGRSDNDTAEFALARHGWKQFADSFPEDPVFAVGHSDAGRHWPYVQPGPADLWAGRKAHTFTVLFGVESRSRGGTCRLWVDLADTHGEQPPRLRVDVNGRLFERALPPGAGDATVNGRPGEGREHRFAVDIPLDAIRAGANAINITTLSGSWILYDWVGFETPGSLAPGAYQSTALRSISAPPVLVREDGGFQQVVAVSLLHLGPEAVASVRVSGAEPVEKTLRSGENSIEAPHPRVSTPTPVEVSIDVAGRSVARRSLVLEPVRKWEVHFLPHSHVDIGFTHLQPEVAKLQWEHFEQAIELARRTAEYPPGSRFKWNVEVLWAVESYLAHASPEKREQFTEAVRNRWIGLDALYGNELTGLCRPEELFELVGYARRLSRTLGLTIDSAMISDVPGYSWGLVPALAQSGVRYLSCGPNHMPHLPHWGDRVGYTLRAWGDRPFYWVSPSGRERVLCWVAGHGYSWFHDWLSGRIAKAGPRPILHYLEELRRSGYPYDMVQLRYTIGADNGPPDADLPDFVKRWNSRYAYPRMVISTTSEMFRAFERRHGGDVPAARGDFTPYWEDGAASSARETAINREAAERLVQAGALWAMVRPRDYPEQEFRAAWRNVVLYDEHTWGAHSSISRPDDSFVRNQWKVKQSFALDAERQSLDLTARALGRRQAGSGVVAAVQVFNTSSWPRTDLVILPKEWKLPGGVVRCATGQPVPSQRLAAGGLAFLARDVPSLGGARFTISAGKARVAGNARAEGAHLTNGTLTADIDQRSGAIANLFHRAIPFDLVDARDGMGLNDYFYTGSNAADPRRNGAVEITVGESGPLVASLVIESQAPGCHGLTRELRVIDGLDRLDLFNVVNKRKVRRKENVRFAFPFGVPDGQLRMDVSWGVVRPDADQLRGANKSYFTVGRWVDVSGRDHGVTWATVDAPLVEVGGMTGESWMADDSRPWVETVGSSQKFYSWVMNNSWHTNYRADQEGPATFRYSVRPHGPFDGGMAERFGTERSQPLIVMPEEPGATALPSLLRIEPAGVVVSSLTPSADGRARMVRLYNATGRPQRVAPIWGAPAPAAAYLSDPFERRGERVTGPLELPAYGLVTLRAEWPAGYPGSTR